MKLLQLLHSPCVMRMHQNTTSTKLLMHRAINVLTFCQQELSYGHTNTHRHMFNQWGAFDQTGNTANTAGRTPTHTHINKHNVPSCFSRESFSDFHLSFFFSGLLFLLSFPFSFTPFCFLFSPFWVFSARRHRTQAQFSWLIWIKPNLAAMCHWAWRTSSFQVEF